MKTYESMEGLPIQPVVVDKDGIIRFQANKIVRDMLGAASAGQKLDLNMIAARLAKNPKVYTRAEQMQFAMLTGYSVSGAGDLSYFDADLIDEAQQEGEGLAERVDRVREVHALKDEPEPRHEKHDPIAEEGKPAVSLTEAMADVDPKKGE